MQIGGSNNLKIYIGVLRNLCYATMDMKRRLGTVDCIWMILLVNVLIDLYQNISNLNDAMNHLFELNKLDKI